MPNQAKFRCLTLALAVSCTTESALGQLATTARRTLVVNPPRLVLGSRVTLSVQGAAPGARYRYVAAISGTAGNYKVAVNCSATTTIGTGTSVTWQPKSGTYRLTAYGPAGRAETDTLTLTYVVRPNVSMLASSQTGAGGGKVTLVLRASDLGPGHTYLWWMQYRGSGSSGGAANPGPPPESSPWTTQTNGPMATYPTPISPPSSIKATVAIHRGDLCDIIAAGAMPANP
ncbi:MAG: hypothetical protein ACT4P6_02300 [Gemmatimonadaceae bacterium]